jgi:transforming growth factor-beta-induced protein
MTAITRRFALALMLSAMIAGACGGSAATTTTTTAAPASTTTEAPAEQEMGDVLEVAAAEGDLNTFLAALEAAGIMEDFHGEGPFTLFIPTDEAFAAYLADAGMTQAEVFAGAEMLQAILNHHIVPMMEDAEMVMGMAGQSFTTAGGQELEVTVEGETVMVDQATVERYDIHASNGIIHVIDTVLIPSQA